MIFQGDRLSVCFPATGNAFDPYIVTPDKQRVRIMNTPEAEFVESASGEIIHQDDSANTSNVDPGSLDSGDGFFS